MTNIGVMTCPHCGEVETLDWYNGEQGPWECPCNVQRRREKQRGRNVLDETLRKIEELNSESNSSDS